MASNRMLVEESEAPPQESSGHRVAFAVASVAVVVAIAGAAMLGKLTWLAELLHLN